MFKIVQFGHTGFLYFFLSVCLSLNLALSFMIPTSWFFLKEHILLSSFYFYLPTYLPTYTSSNYSFKFSLFGLGLPLFAHPSSLFLPCFLPCFLACLLPCTQSHSFSFKHNHTWGESHTLSFPWWVSYEKKSFTKHDYSRETDEYKGWDWKVILHSSHSTVSCIIYSKNLIHLFC